MSAMGTSSSSTCSTGGTALCDARGGEEGRSGIRCEG